ncbi:hypothetical protein [Denitromonas ohlonensis]|uniref:Uncharacterized protein n=2 Tax=Denitromonas TaxID=139331 RepID=A0A557S6T1_9RHOO|nr:hypothetical protein [Denitromonas ohlonensis]TVO63991.1 hypothetical protein FHP90_13190 [Denitromonas ohlonensis]TVO73067.1 hypothetical protein FHP89_17380 [Denitromonas ohlonensis]
MTKTLLTCLLAVLSANATAESMLHSAGKALGQISTGIAEGVTQPLRETQPEWVTIAPRSKQECIAESGGELNTIYMRCRNGRQEYIRHDAAGRKRVLSERPIPPY